MIHATKGQYALVTGATSGMGYELAKLLAQDGYNLVVVARSEENLKKVAEELRQRYNVTVQLIAKDLFGERAGTELYEEVKRLGIEVEVLINNAGQGRFGLFLDLDLEDQLSLVHLNIISFTRLTYHFLKEMKARNSGKILQLASMLSELPAPYNALYGATKAYVLTLTEALISEVKDSAVTLTALEPPVTDTDFWRKSGGLQSKAVQEGPMADPAVVAKAGYEALMRGDDKALSGLSSKVQMAVANLLPDTVVAEGMKKVSEPVTPDND